MDLIDYITRELDFPPILLALGSTFVALVVLGLSIAALVMLRGRPLPPLAKVLWAILIVFAPFMGSLAFLIVSPTAEGSDPREGLG